MYANKHNTVTPIIHNSVLMVILFFMLFLSSSLSLGTIRSSVVSPSCFVSLQIKVVFIDQRLIFGKLHKVGSRKQLCQFIYHLLIAFVPQAIDYL